MMVLLLACRGDFPHRPGILKYMVEPLKRFLAKSILEEAVPFMRYILLVKTKM